MKHEKEINVFLRSVFFEDWMTEEVFQKHINETLNGLGLSLKQLNDDIEVGIVHGYSIEQQFDIIKKALDYQLN